MKFNLFNKNNKTISIKEEWNNLGQKYASDVNEMVAFAETNGWENWKGKDPEDKREHLADDIYNLLKEANKNNTVAAFRENFPPAHSPLVKFFKSKGKVHFIVE